MQQQQQPSCLHHCLGCIALPSAVQSKTGLTELVMLHDCRRASQQLTSVPLPSSAHAATPSGTMGAPTAHHVHDRQHMYECLCLVHLLLRLLAVPVPACQATPHRCDTVMLCLKEPSLSLHQSVKDCVCCCRQVKSREAEQALPEFNLAKVVGSRIQKQGFRQAVLLCVVRQRTSQSRGCALASTAVRWEPAPTL